MKHLLLTLLLLQEGALHAQNTDSLKVPFAGMDLSWINGQNRQQHFPLVLKDKETGEVILTGVAFFDGYYNYDFNHPADNTHTISSSIGRTNEFCVNQVSAGIETSYKNTIGRIWLQYGQMSSIIQDLDATTAHGRNTSIDNLKYIREAAAGYHFDKWYGINIELGMFMSYIGLESYVLNENWCYQRSMPCDFTPFYFMGMRLQVYPTRKLKTELWILNGWQTYNSYNNSPGIGSSTYYRTNENLQLAFNFYLAGKDTRNKPNLLRFHHDHSVVFRYFHHKGSKGLSQAAFSLNNHYGFQSGEGVWPSDQYMVGTSLANRLWFCKDRLGLTLRADYVSNPGLYLAFSPSPVADNDFTEVIAKVPGQKLELFQATATLDLMPNEQTTFRLEYGYREANVPYFAGPGGTTSPDGWVNTLVSNWRPDLVKTESRITLAVSFRL